VLTFAELFAGAGGLSRGLEAAGWECVAHAEINPHARAVLRYRYPDTRLDGDVSLIDGRDYAGITLLSGGSPCQDLSVAGKRAGLGGARSGLFYQQLRIWQESGAPYLLWENVPGALSSNNGKDFAAVLSAIVGSAVTVPADGWRGGGGVVAGRDAVAAWRVLDLQHFGPPQRRARVFVLGARAGGVDPAEVLALSEGVCRHPSPRECAREDAARRAAGGAGAGGVTFALGSHAGCADGDQTNRSHANGGPVGMGISEELSHSLRAGRAQAIAAAQHGVVAFHLTQDPISGAESPALGTTSSGMGVMAYAQRGRDGGAQLEGSEIAPALRTPGGGSSHAIVCATGHVTHALTHEGADASEDGTGRGTPVVVGNSGMERWAETDTAITLAARDAKGGNTLALSPRPRRLTPRECERLMSWPDDWTRYGIDEQGRTYELSDTQRYRLCGNGVGSVCVQWIAQRLADAITSTTEPNAQ
jgi:DNA (cytosine-5)-methyltransferase 1